ncbi:MAG: DNA-binding domain-containing protein [Rubrivivax sp.]|nr:DNA-binding domain-containing protein [Rubrivivax sp.]
MSAVPTRPVQQVFARALLDPALPPPAGLVAWNRSDPAVRFAVYRNNVAASLVAALADTFPVVRELVGADFFTAMARLYVAEQPPTSPVLARYGDGFADWVAQFEPAAAVPYLADMARLERARVHAYHAADAPVLDAGAVAAHLAHPARLPAARLRLHPSVTVLASPWAVVSLWATHQGQGRLEDVDPARPECALVLRFEDDAAVLAIPAAAAEFLGRLQRGLSLGEAAAADEPLDLGATLALLIRHGAISAWSSPE